MCVFGSHFQKTGCHRNPVFSTADASAFMWAIDSISEMKSGLDSLIEFGRGSEWFGVCLETDTQSGL